MLRRLAVAAVLALALAAAGCGGDDEDAGGSAEGDRAPTEWAETVCSSVATWTSTVRALPETLRGSLSAEALDDAVSDVREATDELIDSLRDAGRPDTDSGDEARDELNRLADDLRVQLDVITNAVEGADTPTETLGAVADATAALSGMGNSLTTTLGDLEEIDASGELEDAFRDAEACDDLTSTG